MSGNRMQRLNAKERFFKYDQRDKMYMCNIGSCRGKLKGTESSLRRHVAQLHPKVASQIGLKGYGKQRPNAQQAQSSKQVAPTIKSVSQEEFLAGLLEMVAIHSISLDFFDSDAFAKTIGPVAKSLGLPLKTGFITTLISVAAAQARNLIATELQDKMFSIKFDVVSHRKQKILAVNLQYINEAKFITRTLSIEDVSVSQPLEVLRNRIEAILQSYQINLSNVYSWTTGNGKDMVKCDSEKVEMIRVKTEDSNDNPLGNVGYVTVIESNEFNPVDSDTNNESNVDMQGFAAESNIDGLCATAVIEDDTISDQLLQSLETMFLPDAVKSSDAMKCGLHTLISVVTDSLNTPSDDSLVAIRAVVVATKKPEYRKLFELANIPLPECDVHTRWGSLWSMIESVYKYRVFYKDIGVKIQELSFAPNHWTFIEDFIAAYEPFYKTAESLQRENLTMGDVFKNIKLCQYKIKKLSSENRFVEPILQALETRMSSLFENDLFRVALLFDQRWCFLDSPYYPKDAKMLAIDYALKISNLLKSVQNCTVEPVYKEESAGIIPEDEFEAMLEKECQNESMMMDNSQVDLKLKLIQLANTKTRKPITTDILIYWETKKLEDSELYDLAMVALGSPATLVSLNRCYQAFNMIKDRKRMGMSTHTMHDVLLLKFNQDLIQTAVERSRKQLNK